MELDQIIQEIKDKGLTGYKIAEETGLTEVGINKILNGTSKNPRKKTLDILSNYLSKKTHNYYVAESSALYVNEPEEQITNKNGNVFTELKGGKFKIHVKKVPVKAFASYLSHRDGEFFDELEQVSFTVDHIGRGNYICFEVQGESMNGGSINDAPEGAELLCRELGRQHWKDGFRDSIYGWVIVHKETVLYKDIEEFNPETGDIVCSSRNKLPQYGNFVINLNDVQQIWKVIKRSY